MLDYLKLSRTLSLVSGLSVAGVGTAALLFYKSLYPTRWSLRLPQYGVFSTTRWLGYLTPLQSMRSDEQNEAERRETAKLKRHYETTLDAADEYYSTLLELVANRFIEADGLDAMAVNEAASSLEEEAIANKIKVLAFSRFVASIWSVPVTFLLTRLMFCIYGRLVYLSDVAKGIYRTRSSNLEIKDSTTLPPMCDASYQRRLLRAFESNVPDAICSMLSELVAQIVTNHLEHIPYDKELSETELRALLSTINSEIDLKISRQNGRFWKLLLGTGDGVSGGESGYVQDTMKEARTILGIHSWHLLVINSVKIILKSQLPVLTEAYKSVIAEHKPLEKNKIEDSRQEFLESDDDEGTVVEAEGTLCPATGTMSREFKSVESDDNESEASDNSAYDFGPLPQFSAHALPRDARPVSPDPREWTAVDRSRLVAEGSLEPLEFSDVEEASTYDTSSFSLRGMAINEGPKDYLPVRSVPLPLGRSPVMYPTDQKNKQSVSTLEPTGIPLVRWATKLGQRGKDILTEEEEEVLEDVKKAFSSQSFFLDVFASEPVITLPRSQEETSSVFCSHS